jgi:hypothetical protein
MTLRGVQAHGTRMVTSELLGVLRDDLQHGPSSLT